MPDFSETDLRDRLRQELEREVDRLTEAVRQPPERALLVGRILRARDRRRRRACVYRGLRAGEQDLHVITEINDQLERVLKQVPGTRSVYAERELGGFFLDFTSDREAIARYGLTVRDVLDVVESSIGGMDVDTTIEGRERYRVNVRYALSLRKQVVYLDEAWKEGRASGAIRDVRSLIERLGGPTASWPASAALGD